MSFPYPRKDPPITVFRPFHLFATSEFSLGLDLIKHLNPYFVELSRGGPNTVGISGDSFLTAGVRGVKFKDGVRNEDLVIPALIVAVKQLSNDNNELRARLEALEARPNISTEKAA